MGEVTKSQSIRNFGAKGWFLILYCFTALFCNVAMTIDGLNVALPLVSDGNGLDYNACLSLGTVAGFVGVVLMFVIGKVREKLGNRYTSGGLLIIAGLTYSLFYVSSSSLVMYGVCMSIMVACTQGCFYLCTGPLQARWFPKKRGVVVGITTTGANIGSAILVPLLTALTTFLGWKMGLSVIGIFAVVVGVIGILILRDDPIDAGVYPDNVTKEEYEKEYLVDAQARKEEYKSDWTVKRLLTTKETYLAILVPAFLGLGLVGIVSQFVSRNMALGLSSAQAVGAMTVAAVFGMLGSYLLGIIDTKFGTKTAAIVYSLFFAAAVVINILGQFNVVFVYISIVMVGMSLGGTTNVQISWPASIFGQLDYPVANTVIYPIMYCIISLNFVLNAVVLQVTGTLTMAYVVYAILMIIAALIAKATDSTKWNKEVHPELMK
ncbi:MAG: MFS transporter [Lachnospiraceae bacterium]|nr:MFS transporter [Lachnospiraceae bacterium]